MATNVDEAKLFAMAVLGGGSFVVGLLPGTINRRFHDSNPLFMSFLLCLGAGVLIATSIVHILTEVQEAIPGSAAIYFCLGFFIMYFVDVVFHALFDSHGHDSLEPSQSNSYGSMESERESLLGPGSPPSDAVVAPCPNNNASSKFGLLCALSLHSFLEGLAIGVQDTSAKVLLLITAVACHKYVVGFSLGLEFTSGHGTRRQMWRQLLISMMIFAVGSVLGIALGMALVDLKDLWSSNTIPILQAIAGGTLLYVTLSEVLPREKNKHRSRKAIVLQFVACLLGFTLMAILNSYLVEPETESR